jgi:hypothetical protein
MKTVEAIAKPVLGTRVALVIEDSAKRPEVQGIVTEHELAKIACATRN